MKIKYCIPSYSRAKGLLTPKYIKKGIVYVSPQDYEGYIKYNQEFVDNIYKLPDGVQGKGKAHVMNWLLDNMWDDEDALLFLDDDITTLMAHNKVGKDYEKSEEEFYQICENLCLLAKEWGCGMWSFGINSDPMAYDEFKPFRLHGYLDGTLQGFVLKENIRYDETLTVKEDVDMFLQQCLHHHKALRVDKYYFKVRSFEGEGGSQAFRSVESEKEQFRIMQRKWGDDIVRPNKPSALKASSIRSLGGAIKINLPLSGA